MNQNPVTVTEQNGVALVTVDSPPVNALSQAVRRGISDAVRQVEASDAVAAVLICAGRTFIAGADIREFDGGPYEPILPDVIHQIEMCPKPWVAAIHGTALGGGLEVALCAHFRVATADAQFGLPEVKLGLLPGAGGTQRLPRVTGVPQALQMTTSGNPIGSDAALDCGLIDELVDELEAGAVAFAERVVAEGRPLTRIRDRDDKLAGADEQLFADFRKSIARKYSLQAYSEVMSHFAAAERYLNRVWSASVDGYIDEVRDYTARAGEQFEETARILKTLK